jgi:ABC-type glycerol-3-phosphate transport system permease component
MAKKSKKIFRVSNILFIILFVVLTLYTVSLVIPFLWGIMTSLKTQTEFELDPFGLPSVWHFENYIDALNLFCVRIETNSSGMASQYVYIETMVLNSVLYCFGSAFFSTLAPCLVAYITAKYPYRVMKWINSFVVIAMILPIIGSGPSEMQMVKNLGLYDSFIGFYFMRFSFLGLYYLLFNAAFKNLSWGYAEAAIIDGASDFTIMVKIMLPLVSSTFGVIMLLYFISYWNDYMTPVLYLPSYPTVAVGLYKFYTAPGQQTGLIPMQLTGCMLVMIPILIVFIIFRNKIMGNVAIGGLKG